MAFLQPQAWEKNMQFLLTPLRGKHPGRSSKPRPHPLRRMRYPGRLSHPSGQLLPGTYFHPCRKSPAVHNPGVMLWHVHGLRLFLFLEM